MHSDRKNFGHFFLRDWKPEHRGILEAFSSRVIFKPGEFIFRQGQEARHFYLINTGKVSLEEFSATGGPVVLQTLAEDEVLGWSWLVEPYQWRFDARSISSTDAIQMDAIKLRHWIENDHEFGYEFWRRFIPVLTNRLEAARLQMIEIYAAHS